MTTTSESSSQQSIALTLRPKEDLVRELLLGAIVNAPIHVQGVKRIPIAPLLDNLRRITGKEDEAETCMEFIRKTIDPSEAAEIGRVGDDDANYIIIYPRNNKPRDFRKSKTNTLTVVELVKVALFLLENEGKPYQTINGIKVTRSNLTTAREISAVILTALPGIKISSFADKYTAKQIDQLITKFSEIKKLREREEAIAVLKEKGYTQEMIDRIFKSS